MSREILIGIDTGVKTGFAVWDIQSKKLLEVSTCSILEAMERVMHYKSGESELKGLYIEDARKVKYKTSAIKAQGAGSIKRDCQIWEEFTIRHKIKATFLRPNKKLTKFSKGKFGQITGWEKRSSEHARDAAMLVYGRAF